MCYTGLRYSTKDNFIDWKVISPGYYYSIWASELIICGCILWSMLYSVNSSQAETMRKGNLGCTKNRSSIEADGQLSEESIDGDADPSYIDYGPDPESN